MSRSLLLFTKAAAFVLLVAAAVAAAGLVDFSRANNDASRRDDSIVAVSGSPPEIIAGGIEATNDRADPADVASAIPHSEVKFTEIGGGPHYYSRFKNGLPDDPSFFPIGVWYESVTSQADINLDKDVGLNLYIKLTESSNLSLLGPNDMYAILGVDQGWSTNQAAIANPNVVGWELADEIDMQQANAAGAAAARTELNSIIASLPADGRLHYNNYAKGVMFWNSDSDAEQYVNDFQDVTSVDNYWFTDPYIYNAGEGGKLLNNGNPLSTTQTRLAANYGYTVDRLQELDAMDGDLQPIWAFVEVGWPYTESGGRQIAPAEIKAAVWHSIIAGARGIIYFNHSFGGPDQSQHALREPAYAAQRAAVKETTALIHQLASVLNAPFANHFVKTDGRVRVMAKKLTDDKYYVFAASLENAKIQPTFALSGVNSGMVTVLGETRTIPIIDGAFTDNFVNGNSFHIYRIDNDESRF